MLITAHLAAGLIIGALTDQYLAAIAVSLLVDLDHLVPYFEKDILKDLRKFWKHTLLSVDPHGSPRNLFHSIFFWLILAVIGYAYWPSYWVVISASHLAHLILDMFEASPIRIFWPVEYEMHGIIEYKSWHEWTFTGLLIFIWSLMVF
jgi:hypothetical protein